jgi:hypothetical protein
MKPRLWLTYAWTDNHQQDVDFVIQELTRRGIDVHYDRAQLLTGRRLWSQIDASISDPSKSDAWALVATKSSLESEPCQEEIAYALDRALRTRGGTFPLIGIFPTPLDRLLIPSAIATRLYVTLKDAKWADTVAADLRGEAKPAPGSVQPFVFTEHSRTGGGTTIEMRPRSGQWYPGIIVVPLAERALLLGVEQGAPGVPPRTSMTGSSSVTSEDGTFVGRSVNHAITNELSMFVHFSAKPSEVRFGTQGQMYIAKFGPD